VRGGLPLVFIDTVSVVPRMWAVRSAQNVGGAWVEELSSIRIGNTRVVFVVDPLFIDGYIRLCYQSALARTRPSGVSSLPETGVVRRRVSVQPLSESRLRCERRNPSTISASSPLSRSSRSPGPRKQVGRGRCLAPRAQTLKLPDVGQTPVSLMTSQASATVITIVRPVVDSCHEI
jgi:hypothetical protein